MIRAERVGKRYQLGAAHRNRESGREALSRLARTYIDMARARSGKSGPTRPEEFWALREVDFEIHEGEVLGIVGRNGAGKSTLLKILSRITGPTTGQIGMRGTVGALLEVGTGFHQDLSGRENIFLNGAVLGMPRREILARFDEIVEFAGVERFIDTPVKRYSSGMYLRLAFSVAAHLQSDILIVDEVLAVGDTEFQKKCLGKMEDVSHQGRTTLFVSHNMTAVSALCRRAMTLDHGRVVYSGDVSGAIAAYESSLPATATGVPGLLYINEPRGLDTPEVTRVEMLDREGQPLDALRTWSWVRFRIWYSARQPVKNASVEFRIRTPGGAPLVHASTRPDDRVALDLEPGRHFVDCIIEQFPLAAGEYVVGVGLTLPWTTSLFDVDDAATLEVREADVYESGFAPTANRGIVVPRWSWEADGEALMPVSSATE